MCDEPARDPDELHDLLAALSRRRQASFLRRSSCDWDPDNVLTPVGAAAALALLPAWTLGDGGTSLCRRFDLERPSEATALLAAVHAFVGGDRWRPSLRCELGESVLDLALGAPGSGGLPVWLATLALRLDELFGAPSEEALQPAPLEEIRDAIEESERTWRLRAERNELVGTFFFVGALQAMRFACLTASMAVLKRHLVAVALEIDGDVVRVRIANAGGGAVSSAALLFSYDVTQQASASVGEEPAGDVQLPTALAEGGRDVQAVARA